MKLSEAIRKGCEGTYQTFLYSDFRGGCCALGAAMIAIGKPHYVSSDIVLEFPILNQPVKCPRPDCTTTKIPMKIVINGCLNCGRHRWTRELIADWVETIENQSEQARLTSPETMEETPSHAEQSEAIK